MKVFYKKSDDEPTVEELIFRYRTMQMDNLVKAIDVPKQILELDKAYYCINVECFSVLRNKCELFERYIQNPLVVKDRKWLEKNVKQEQKQTLKREKWDKNIGKPRYFCSCYAMLPEQKGKTCDFFIQKTERSNEN